MKTYNFVLDIQFQSKSQIRITRPNDYKTKKLHQ
jgi:hypothetical protein